MMCFSQRMEAEQAFREWARKGKIDPTRPMSVLAWLETPDGEPWLDELTPDSASSAPLGPVMQDRITRIRAAAKRSITCPICGQKADYIAYPVNDNHIVVGWVSNFVETTACVTTDSTVLCCPYCGTNSEAADWGIDMTLLENDYLALERAAETVRAARLAWFKELREGNKALPGKALGLSRMGTTGIDTGEDHAYAITWGAVEGTAHSLGLDIASFTGRAREVARAVIKRSLQQQIDRERIIRVAVVDAHERTKKEEADVDWNEK